MATLQVPLKLLAERDISQVPVTSGKSGSCLWKTNSQAVARAQSTPPHSVIKYLSYLFG